MSALVETMFYRGREPWHKLGRKIDFDLNAGEAIAAAGLDWRVSVQPIYSPEFLPPTTRTHPFTGEEITSPGRFMDPGAGSFEEIEIGGVVRRDSDGAALGLVGGRWAPVQNVDAFAFFDPLVTAGLAGYHTAGSLNGGRVVWILAQIGNAEAVTGDDRLANFVLLSMGHDGSKGVSICPTPVRVVCANTLAAAEGKASKVTKRIQHTATARRRLEDFGGFLKPYAENFENLRELFRTLASRELNRASVETIVRELFPDPERQAGAIKAPSTARVEKVRDGILSRFEGTLIGMEAIPAANRRSAWTLYNAITEYVDHDRGRNEDSRLSAAWFGAGRDLKSRSLNVIRGAVAA